MTIVGFCAAGIFKSPDIPVGNPYRLIYPSDYQGNVCGYDEAFKSKPYGYFLPDQSGNYLFCFVVFSLFYRFLLVFSNLC
jgi:hypothetical protein